MWVSQPPGRGGQAGWDKIPSLAKEINFRLPLLAVKVVSNLKKNGAEDFSQKEF